MESHALDKVDEATRDTSKLSTFAIISRKTFKMCSVLTFKHFLKSESIKMSFNRSKVLWEEKLWIEFSLKVYRCVGKMNFPREKFLSILVSIETDESLPRDSPNVTWVCVVCMLQIFSTNTISNIVTSDRLQSHKENDYKNENKTKRSFRNVKTLPLRNVYNEMEIKYYRFEAAKWNIRRSINDCKLNLEIHFPSVFPAATTKSCFHAWGKWKFMENHIKI